MKKIKLVLSGRGAECYVHNITEQQKEKLINAGILDNKMSVDSICEMLEIEFFDEKANIYTGAYTNSSDFNISVYNETNDLIWESDENFEFNEEFSDDWWNEVESEEDEIKLIVEDYIKGTFQTYELELSEDFDPSKLSPIMLEISESVEIIAGFKYDGQELNKPELGDFLSKGFSFHIYSL